MCMGHEKSVKVRLSGAVEVSYSETESSNPTLLVCSGVEIRGSMGVPSEIVASSTLLISRMLHCLNLLLADFCLMKSFYFADSDEDEMISESLYEDEQGKKHVKESQQESIVDQLKWVRRDLLTVDLDHQKSDDYSAAESGSSYTSGQDDDTAMSGRDKVLSSSSRFASPEDPRNKQICTFEPTLDLLAKQMSVNVGLNGNLSELLKYSFIIALRSRDCLGYHVSRQRIPGCGWFLDTMSDVSRRDPGAQFLVSTRSKDILG
ncbi:C-terminal binding protein AN-like [Canna indica]|uniref:C-terminal binding protein AN-like n=1 Tax=Canna indica TaxID=4628 RepID=A0AAQ3JNN1_9LILI|nr:C-terminal binding protein AN-like [Canna indica]